MGEDTDPRSAVGEGVIGGAHFGDPIDIPSEQATNVGEFQDIAVIATHTAIKRQLGKITKGTVPSDNAYVSEPRTPD